MTLSLKKEMNGTISWCSCVFPTVKYLGAVVESAFYKINKSYEVSLCKNEILFTLGELLHYTILIMLCYDQHLVLLIT